ncbi:hypothetical protein BJV74DRAFT_474550 [Russula compacta]|nr:hypothetical protein BJV74DRAFT_474550 [Russula compacta]
MPMMRLFDQLALPLSQTSLGAEENCISALIATDDDLYFMVGAKRRHLDEDNGHRAGLFRGFDLGASISGQTYRIAYAARAVSADRNHFSGIKEVAFCYIFVKDGVFQQLIASLVYYEMIATNVHLRTTGAGVVDQWLLPHLLTCLIVWRITLCRVLRAPCMTDTWVDWTTIIRSGEQQCSFSWAMSVVGQSNHI